MQKGIQPVEPVKGLCSTTILYMCVQNHTLKSVLSKEWIQILLNKFKQIIPFLKQLPQTDITCIRHHKALLLRRAIKKE